MAQDALSQAKKSAQGLYSQVKSGLQNFQQNAQPFFQGGLNSLQSFVNNKFPVNVPPGITPSKMAAASQFALPTLAPSQQNSPSAITPAMNRSMSVISPTLPQTPPGLYTQGGQILRKDTKQPIQLKGMTSNAFRYPWTGGEAEEPEKLGYRSVDDVIKRLTVTKQWGGNIVNLYLDPQMTKQKINDLDKVVDWAGKNGLYVVLNPTGGSEEMQTGKFADLAKILSQRYKKNPHVIYGVWSEPHELNNEGLYGQTKNIIQSIRANNPNAPVMLGGSTGGREFNYLQKNPLNIPNVIYDFHEYPLGQQGDEDRIRYSPANYKWMQGKYPIMQGEFGKYWLEDFGSKPDLEFIQNKLNEAAKEKYNTLGYALDESGGLGLINSQGMPTPKGEVFRQDLQKNPVTTFNPGVGLKPEDLLRIYGRYR